MKSPIDVQEIMREIRARILDRTAPEYPQQGSVPVLPAPGVPDWTRLEEAGIALASAHSLIGQFPPEPPTLRGRVGAFLVSLVRRALFWHTSQIVEFSGAVACSFNELLAAIKTVAAAVQQGWTALDALNRQVAGLRAETERLEKMLGARREEILTIVKLELLPEIQARHLLEYRLEDATRKFDGLAQTLSAEMGAREELARRVDAEVAAHAAALAGGLAAEAGAREELARRVDAESAARTAALTEGLSAEMGAREELARRVDAGIVALERLNQTLAAETGVREFLTQRVNAEVAAREALAHDVVTVSNRFHSIEAGLRQSDIRLLQLRAEVINQNRRVSILLEEARKRLPAPFDEKQLVTMTGEEKHSLDAVYVSFEDQFRGTRAEIKDRSRVYLPFLRERKIGTKNMPILDVGCGRGEWLELLLENQLDARGIDINRVLLAYCKEAGLDVAEDDILEHLKNQPDRSLGAVTGFHIIEHLPFDILVRVFDETARVLKPGGIAIFETPNPQNVLVGSHTFYLDFTHRNPLPSLTTQFILEARGLCDVQILNLHPYPESSKLLDDGTELVKRFNEYFYGPQDYAVIGRKA